MANLKSILDAFSMEFKFLDERMPWRQGPIFFKRLIVRDNSGFYNLVMKVMPLRLSSG